jgi:hypothetical protein
LAVVDSRVEFSYDGLARVKTVCDFIEPTVALDTTTFDLDYSYDTIDRRVYTDAKFSETGLNPTGDFENRYVWDDLNRVKRVEQFTPSDADPNVLDPALKKTVDLEYYAHGALKKITRVQGSDPSTGVADTASDALVTDYVLEYPEWWFVGRISRIEHSGFYDNEGNRIRRTDNTSGDYEIYAWDFRNRLTSVTSRNVQGATTNYISYEYDGLDRRIRRKEQVYSPPGTPGAVLSQDRYLYDTKGLVPPIGVVQMSLTCYAAVVNCFSGEMFDAAGVEDGIVCD